MTTLTSDVHPEPVKVELQRLYTREHTCKVPHAPDIFGVEGPHQMHTEISIQAHPTAPQQYEVTLGMTVTTKCQDRTALMIEIKQCGQFKTECTDQEKIAWLCQVDIPTLLFPYARKIIADGMLNAGFAAHVLPPMDFASLYRQRQAKQQAASGTHEKSPDEIPGLQVVA